MLSSHKRLLFLAISHSIAWLHRDGVLALEQTTSMSVLALVTVIILASMYQIVPSIIFRVTVTIHADMYQIVLSVVVRVLLTTLALLCQRLPFMTDPVTILILVAM